MRTDAVVTFSKNVRGSLAHWLRVMYDDVLAMVRQLRIPACQQPTCSGQKLYTTLLVNMEIPTEMKKLQQYPGRKTIFYW